MLCYKDKKKNIFLTPMTKTGVGVARCQVTNSTLDKIHLHCCVTSVAGFAFYGFFFFFFFLLYEDRQVFLINAISSISKWDRRKLKVGGWLAPEPPYPHSLLC